MPVTKNNKKAKSCPTTPQKDNRKYSAEVDNSNKGNNNPIPFATPEKKKPSNDTNTLTPKTSRKDSHNSKDDEIENIISSRDAEALDLADTSNSNKKKLNVKWRVEKAYQILRNTTGQLGGNGYNGAIYGELTMRSMQRVINLLVDKCDLNSSSRFIDVGAGLGKPNFHAAQDPAVRLSIGVELEEIRWQLSMHNMDKFLTHVNSAGQTENKRNREDYLYGGVNFILNDIDNATSTDPFTHIYMFDLGFPPPLQKSIARKFNSSMHAVCLVSYRPPRRVINEYGYAVEFVDQILSSMHGSGEGHTAYIYRRINKPPKTPVDSNQCRLEIPPRLPLPEQGESTSSVSSNKKSRCKGKESNDECDIVYCDPIFYEACNLALQNDIEQLRSHVKTAVNEHMEAKRPQRQRKQRVLYQAEL